MVCGCETEEAIQQRAYSRAGQHCGQWQLLGTVAASVGSEPQSRPGGRAGCVCSSHQSVFEG